MSDKKEKDKTQSSKKSVSSLKSSSTKARTPDNSLTAIQKVRLEIIKCIIKNGSVNDQTNPGEKVERLTQCVMNGTKENRDYSGI